VSGNGSSPSLGERLDRIEQRLDRIEAAATAPPGATRLAAPIRSG